MFPSACKISTPSFNRPSINRAQTLEETARAIDLFRAQGVNSINVDLVYGLPQQTQETLELDNNNRFFCCGRIVLPYLVLPTCLDAHATKK